MRKETQMKKFFIQKKGQSLMEYLIITSLIGIFCLYTTKQLGQVIQKRINDIKKEIVKAIP